ncbi:MAG: hypothetical protein IJW37_04875 [Lachnospiraceae bacterium]|nr:hypothetical protein [Lachnospiraceae bacterium]
MTLYEKFKKLKIDLSLVGLEKGSAKSDYFCTPKGAKIIGWAGVDGIHYCFLKDFGETVFAVNPMELPGNYVHPLAKSFEDFLKLLLACGDLAAMEQAHAWDQELFDEFVTDNPPSEEQTKVLDLLEEKLFLTPMEAPFAYIKELQAEFDYSKIPYKPEYYECVPEEPKETKPLEWKVSFDGGFWNHQGKGKAGTEVLVGKEFIWNGAVWHIPAVYVCGKGLVVDSCVEVEPEKISAFFEKWVSSDGREVRLSEEDRERMMRENPLSIDVWIKAEMNGKEQRNRHGSGMCFVPEACFMEGMENSPEAEAVVEHYGLDKEKGWIFQRMSFPWVTKTKPTLRKLALELEQPPVAVPVLRFATPEVGESVSFVHPVTGDTHTLTVQSYERQELEKDRFPMEDYEFPSHYARMTYTLSPDLSDKDFSVRDVCRNDEPRRKPTKDGFGAASIGIIGGADGPTAVFFAASGAEIKTHAACSALHFEPAEAVEWQAVVRVKRCEDVKVELYEG